MNRSNSVIKYVNTDAYILLGSANRIDTETDNFGKSMYLPKFERLN